MKPKSKKLLPDGLIKPTMPSKGVNSLLDNKIQVILPNMVNSEFYKYIRIELIKRHKLVVLKTGSMEKHKYEVLKVYMGLLTVKSLAPNSITEERQIEIFNPVGTISEVKELEKKFAQRNFEIVLMIQEARRRIRNLFQ